MANPQPTDAHLRVAHTINEQLMGSHFTEQQRRILDLILRLSWGCDKKTAIIPHQSTFEIVGVRRQHIKEHLDWLIGAKVIFREGDVYGFNKDFDQWRVSRALAYSPKKLRELVKLNLEDSRHNVTENVTGLSRNTLQPRNGIRYKSTTKLASPKEKVYKRKESIYSLFNLWNEQKIIVHKKLTDDIQRSIKTSLESHSEDEITRAIKNYAVIVHGEEYYFKYRWTLKDFLKRGLEKFLDLEVAKNNYRRDKRTERNVNYEDA